MMDRLLRTALRPLLRPKAVVFLVTTLMPFISFLLAMGAPWTDAGVSIRSSGGERVAIRFPVVSDRPGELGVAGSERVHIRVDKPDPRFDRLTLDVSEGSDEAVSRYVVDERLPIQKTGTAPSPRETCDNVVRGPFASISNSKPRSAAVASPKQTRTATRALSLPAAPVPDAEQEWAVGQPHPQPPIAPFFISEPKSPDVTSSELTLPVSAASGEATEKEAAEGTVPGSTAPIPASSLEADEVATRYDATSADGETSLTETEELPAASPLRSSEGGAGRSEEMERVAREADRRTRRGIELAGRKAHYAARGEFITAIRLVSQGLDSEYGTASHSQSLAAGLTAIKEVKDFVPVGARLEADLALALIIESHATPLLHGADTNDLTPMMASRSYFTFAQEQLAASVGKEVAGSMALYSLGKLYGILGDSYSLDPAMAEPAAMTFYQAALLVNPRNSMASNDLGVLFARCGQYREARDALDHSLSIRPRSVSWHNLAAVYQRLGRAEAAGEARRKAIQTEGSEQHTSDKNVRVGLRWVDPAAFASRPSDVTSLTASSLPGEIADHGDGGHAPHRSTAAVVSAVNGTSGEGLVRAFGDGGKSWSVPESPHGELLVEEESSAASGWSPMPRPRNGRTGWRTPWSILMEKK